MSVKAIMVDVKIIVSIQLEAFTAFVEMAMK